MRWKRRRVGGLNGDPFDFSLGGGGVGKCQKPIFDEIHSKLMSK